MNCCLQDNSDLSKFCVCQPTNPLLDKTRQSRKHCQGGLQPFCTSAMAKHTTVFAKSAGSTHSLINRALIFMRTQGMCQHPKTPSNRSAPNAIISLESEKQQQDSFCTGVLSTRQSVFRFLCRLYLFCLKILGNRRLWTWNQNKKREI